MSKTVRKMGKKKHKSFFPSKESSFKYANQYDTDGNMIHPVKKNKYGSYTNKWSIEEVEEYIDNYKGDKNNKRYSDMVLNLSQMYNTRKVNIADRLNPKALQSLGITTDQINEELNEIESTVVPGQDAEIGIRDDGGEPEEINEALEGDGNKTEDNKEINGKEAA